MGLRIFRRLDQLLDVLLSSPTDGQVLTYDSGSSKWRNEDATGGGGGGAPTDATYLVTTADPTLSAEVVVGATPGGELGGTWASPTVDATHSGSSHAAVQAAAEATAAAALAAHEADSTNVHGIADTSALATTDALSTHEADTTNVHGITDTSTLYRSGGTDVAVADGGTGASSASAARTNLGLVINTDVPSQASFDDHSARHESGGADAIKLDDLAAPDDNTDLDASTSKHGLLKKLPGGTTTFLRADGSFAAVPGATPTFHGVRAVETTDQAIASGGSGAAITFNDADTYDTDGYHDTSSNTSRLTVPSGLGGYYHISGNVRWEAAGAGSYRRIRIKVNGTTDIAEILDATEDWSAGIVSQTYFLSATDYVELWADHDAGANRAIKHSFKSGYFQMELVGT